MATAKCNGNSADVLVPAAAYYRMSDDEQKDSIDAQRLLVVRYAADHGYGANWRPPANRLAPVCRST